MNKSRKNVGFIYIFSNPSFKDGMIKIGQTAEVYKRKSELNSTGVPTPFKTEYFAEINNYEIIEKKVHKILRQYRVNKDREFFNCSIPEAINVIRECSEIHDEKIYYKSPEEIEIEKARLDSVRLLKEKEKKERDERDAKEKEEQNRWKKITAFTNSLYNQIFEEVFDKELQKLYEKGGSNPLVLFSFYFMIAPILLIVIAPLDSHVVLLPLCFVVGIIHISNNNKYNESQDALIRPIEEQIKFHINRKCHKMANDLNRFGENWEKYKFEYEGKIKEEIKEITNQLLNNTS